VPSVGGPYFAAIDKHRDVDGCVDSNLGGCDKTAVEKDTTQQSAEGGRGSLNAMLNFAV